MMLSNKKIKRCFTIPELMVAMAMTSALVLFFVTIVDTIQKTVKRSGTVMDATSKARFVFDRIGIDLKKMPKRADIDYWMTNSVREEDFLRFITQIKGPDSDRSVSLVGYKIQPNSMGVPGVYRGIHGYQWKDLGFMGVNAQGNVPKLLNLPPDLDLAPEEYELIVPGVLKVAIVFQYKSDGRIYRKPPYFQFTTNNSISRVQITNISSIVIGMVVMELANKEIINQEISEELANQFTEVPEGITPLPHWNTNLDFNFSKEIPKPIAQSIKIYQRFYPLD